MECKEEGASERQNPHYSTSTSPCVTRACPFEESIDDRLARALCPKPCAAQGADAGGRAPRQERVVECARRPHQRVGWAGPIIIFLLCISQISSLRSTRLLDQRCVRFVYGLTIAGTRSSKKLIQDAMEGALRAPMSFSDTTPIGRILLIERYGRDGQPAHRHHARRSTAWPRSAHTGSSSASLRRSTRPSTR